jgi:hypothetical protein
VLPVGWLVGAVVLAVLLTMWVTFTITRLDRLHARVDAAQASMDAQLVRRAAALLHVAESSDGPLPDPLRADHDRIATRALNTGGVEAERQDAENAVGRAVVELGAGPRPLGHEAAAELQEAAARVLIARRFYNDAVRDTRALRARRMPRLFRMAGRRAMPEFFDIDDTVPNRAHPAPAPPAGTALGALPPTPEPPTPEPSTTEPSTTEEDQP